MIPLILFAIAVLIMLYMTYPRFLRRRLSAARFFKDLPPPRKGQSRLRLGKLYLSLPFFLQLFFLLLLLAALFFSGKKLKGNEAEGLGVWFIVDTSASMSTLQGEETRITAAIREVKLGIEQARQAAKDRELCFRLSAMDLERRDLVVAGDAFSINQAIDNLTPRPLGTDIGIIRQVFQRLKDQSQLADQCTVSHIVVVTDIPDPGWLWESNDIEVLWRDVGQPVDNVGFTNIQAARNPLTGLASEVLIEVTAFGTPPAPARIMVTAPDGTRVKDEVMKWQQGQRWQGRFTPQAPGLYRLQLSPDDAYLFDDSAVIKIDEGQVIRVDWQLPDRRQLREMGWIDDKTNPHLRITSNSSIPMDIPTLIIGSGYRSSNTRAGDTEISVIRDFMETSPLLADVNLDAVETLNLRGIELPEQFQPVLRGIDGTIWLAQAENPLRAFVPGLPTGMDDVVGRFSATVFFNAVRWLLQKRDLPALFTLTSPYEPEPKDNRLVLHKDEGNTQRNPRSSGKIEDLKPVTGKGKGIPFWPILLMLAAVLFLIERTIALFQ